MSTRERLINAAADLLDRGGETAVTLRAVAQAVGVSHNAPYKHFEDRATLLAAVAERDFERMAAAFEHARTGTEPPLRRLEVALLDLITWSRAKPSRYRLLFSDPEIGATGGSLETAALQTFGAFVALVDDAIADGALAEAAPATLAGLIYATLHGLIDLSAGGRMKEQKGFSSAEKGITDLLTILNRRANDRG